MLTQYNEVDKINDRYAEEIGEGNENKREEGNALDIGSISVNGQSVLEGTLEQGRQRHKVDLFYVCVPNNARDFCCYTPKSVS